MTAGPRGESKRRAPLFQQTRFAFAFATVPHVFITPSLLDRAAFVTATGPSALAWAPATPVFLYLDWRTVPVSTGLFFLAFPSASEGQGP